MTHIIINRERLDADLPAIAIIDDDGSVRYADEVVIGDVKITGTAMGHDKVSGARIWIETDVEVRTNG